MIVSQEIVIILAILALGSFAGAISVTISVNQGCAFMFNFSSKCYDYWYQLTLCCDKCCDRFDYSCICTYQQVTGFGFTMIILFWTLFAILGASAGITYSKLKKGEDRAVLLQ